MAETKLTATQIFDGYYQAMKLSYPDNQTAHAVAREVRDIFTEYAAQQQGEHERVLAVLREHEWRQAWSGDEIGHCPICTMPRSEGHSAICWLAALLAAEGEGE